MNSFQPCLFMCFHRMAVKLVSLLEIYMIISCYGLAWTHYTPHLKKQNGEPRKHQLNKPERRELFSWKCHPGVAESPEDQTGSLRPQRAQTAVHIFPFLVLVLRVCSWASLHTHIHTHGGLFFSSEMSINTKSHCLGGREMCILINRVCELPTHPDIRGRLADRSSFQRCYAMRRKPSL